MRVRIGKTIYFIKTAEISDNCILLITIDEDTILIDRVRSQRELYKMFKQLLTDGYLFVGNNMVTMS